MQYAKCIKICDFIYDYPEDVISDGPNICILKNDDNEAFYTSTGIFYEITDDIEKLKGKSIIGCKYQVIRSSTEGKTIQLLPAFKIKDT